jgi:phosphopantetheinyl transferase
MMASTFTQPGISGTPGPRALPPPSEGVVRIWRFAPEWLAGIDGHELRGLQADETRRAAGIANPERRELYVQQRHALRAALAACLAREPAALRLRYGTHGKPSLAPPDEAWQFSLSHAGGAAILAAAVGAPLGIDLERVRHQPRDELAQRLLGERALDIYRTLPVVMRNQAFAWAWAEREAYVKALGLGIGDGWSLAARLFADESLPLGTEAGSSRSVAGWTLTHLASWPGHACVLCSARPPLRIECLDPEG